MGKKETLTTAQVAEMCGVHLKTVVRWIQAGYFPGAWKPPGKASRHRIPKDEVETFIAEMYQRVARRYVSQEVSPLEERLRQPGQRGVLAALAEMLQQCEGQQEQKRMQFALVVEDDADAGEIFEFTLEAVGFTVAIVKSGSTALSWLASMVPDVLVLDLHLPDVPGTEVLRQVRANPRLAGVPVIVATAHPELAERIEEEADLVLIKPVRYDELQGKAVELAGVPSPGPSPTERGLPQGEGAG